ncbi:hypothetical protein bthur0011_57990 [Bacillus thuringiensis serovar huazhongensis BGSC 4BD1]|nr:hypothetical protein bthur0011_57990 [Bacillus thuringiensis serovar huazhongensis BGSC 4BD1]
MMPTRLSLLPTPTSLLTSVWGVFIPGYSSKDNYILYKQNEQLL